MDAYNLYASVFPFSSDGSGPAGHVFISIVNSSTNIAEYEFHGLGSTIAYGQAQSPLDVALNVLDVNDTLVGDAASELVVSSVREEYFARIG